MLKPYREFHLLQALKQWEAEPAPLDLAMHFYFRKFKALGSKDRAFIAENIYSLVRWKALLDWYVPDQKNWENRWEILNSKPLEMLRSDPKLPPYVRVSAPEWLFNKLKEQYGEDAAENLCLVCNTQAPATIRTNLLKTTRDELFESLSAAYDIKKTTRSPYAITFNKRLNYFELPEFKKGWFEVQDEGSQLIADLVQPSSGDLVMDFCAGSGGKTLAFAHHLKGSGQIYLHDIRKRALLEARKRLKRAGIQNAQTISHESPHLKKLKRKMAWVLADVPCSGTGTLRRNPDMKWKFQPTDLQQLIKEQRLVFEQALSYLASDGKIVYATCSILFDENEDQTAYFLKTYPVKLTATPLKILPTLNGPDGFYGVVFERS